MFDIIKSTLTDNALLGAIFSSMAIILLGFYLRKREILNSSAAKMLTKVVLTVALPALAFTSFMKDLNQEELKQGMNILIWIFQDYMPQVAVTTKEGVANYAFLRIDETLPWLYKPLTYLQSLASPLAWLSIGATLAEVPFKKAVAQKDAWGYSLIKVIAVPMINIALLIVLSATGILPVAHSAMATTVIMMAAPTATVAAAYAISFDKEALFTSNCSLLSTVVAVIATPFWIVVLELLKNTRFFI